MPYDAKMILDSITPDGARIISIEAEFPRFILAEVNTHRDRARNSASSRAIPIAKMIEKCLKDPFTPIWTSAQKGMQGGDELTEEQIQRANIVWSRLRQQAVDGANELMDIGIAKQNANRVLEPFMFHRALITATTWSNFFTLRCHWMAQPEFKVVADMIRDCIRESKPRMVYPGEWHLPYIYQKDVEIAQSIFPSNTKDYMRNRFWYLAKISTARCSRLSYLTQDGIRSHEKDLEQHDRLVGADPKHGSPAEHPAMALEKAWTQSGPFSGWKPYRMFLDNEHATQYEYEGWTIK